MLLRRSASAFAMLPMMSCRGMDVFRLDAAPRTMAT
jgi:hypothetical protein